MHPLFFPVPITFDLSLNLRPPAHSADSRVPSQMSHGRWLWGKSGNPNWTGPGYCPSLQAQHCKIGFLQEQASTWASPARLPEGQTLRPVTLRSVNQASHQGHQTDAQRHTAGLHSAHSGLPWHAAALLICLRSQNNMLNCSTFWLKMKENCEK